MDRGRRLPRVGWVWVLACTSAQARTAPPAPQPDQHRDPFAVQVAQRPDQLHRIVAGVEHAQVRVRQTAVEGVSLTPAVSLSRGLSDAGRYVCETKRATPRNVAVTRLPIR